MYGDGNSSDIEFMLPPPLSGRPSSLAPPPAPAAKPSAAVVSSSQPVFIEIDNSDDEDGNAAAGPSHRMEVDDTPPRLAVPKERLQIQKTVSAPAVFPATTATATASTSYNASTSRLLTAYDDDDDDSDELPDLAMAALPNRQNKGKGRAQERPLALSETEEEQSSQDEDEPAKKKRKAAATKGKKGGSSSDTATMSKAELKKREALEKKKAKEREKAEKAVSQPVSRPVKEADPKSQITAAAEKEAKKSLNASNKLVDRKEAASELLVDFSEALLQEGSPFFDNIYLKLTANLHEINCAYTHRVAPPAPCFPKIINWKRKVTKDWDSSMRYWRPRHTKDHTIEEEPTILLYLSVQDVERAVEAAKLNRAGTGEGTLVDIVGKARAAHASDYQVFLLIQNLNDKAKAKKTSDNANWQAEARGGVAAAARKKKGKYNPDVSMEDIEMELCRVMLAERCFIIRPEKWDEAVDWLVELTKDIGYRPYK